MRSANRFLSFMARYDLNDRGVLGITLFADQSANLLPEMARCDDPQRDREDTSHRLLLVFAPGDLTVADAQCIRRDSLILAKSSTMK